ncbi:capsular polysaccharide biosynthesis protein CapK [Amylibacter marinus]|uniref:Capsular polysaccharide biosynthesis protein CapK n=1 Tax=Amylibacter marinus TaxID=1475483 RepID=A0ABQ5VWZ9_9RHOB|nr:hypothetical protein [Amylibacter marinus]GLQ35963.1 capsular polysaccharide biosynthesis protein CapK [Amylibacter marinus]
MGLQKHAEQIYPRLPIWAQNALISVQGTIFRKQRYGAGFKTELAQLIAQASRPRAELEQLQLDKLRAFLIHAQDTCPHYTAAFKQAGFDPHSLNSLSDLQHCPILEKDTLRRETDRIASTKYDPKSLNKSFTSGTTGTPISVAFTPADTRTRFATLQRMFAQFDIPLLPKSVRFSGRTLFPNAQQTKVFWRMNWPMRQMLMSSYNLKSENLLTYVDRLITYEPELIDGYPSAIYILARFINAHGLAGKITPRLIMTTAETLEPFQREEIAAAFGDCPILNQYASSEGAPFITQDINGDLVINTDSGVFEFVRAGTDIPAQAGETAEMLVTSFTTHAYPLIRYRIGDSVTLPDPARHAKSWDMPVVQSITGRQEDILHTTERGYVGRLDPVFKKTPSTIVECQIEQTAPMAITLRVVPDTRAGFKDTDLDGVRSELLARLGAVEITTEHHQSLPRGTNGKLRAVIGMKDNSPHS